jgi:hypothetical protein
MATKSTAGTPTRTTPTSTTGLPKTTSGMRRSTPAKTSAAKKTASKRAAAPRSGGTTAATTTDASSPRTTDAPPANTNPDRAPDSPAIAQTVAPSGEPTITEADVAAYIVAAGRNNRLWGSGRERDIALKKAGHDPKLVAREVRKLRAAKKS